MSVLVYAWDDVWWTEGTRDTMAGGLYLPVFRSVVELEVDVVASDKS